MQNWTVMSFMALCLLGILWSKPIPFRMAELAGHDASEESDDQSVAREKRQWGFGGYPPFGGYHSPYGPPIMPHSYPPYGRFHPYSFGGYPQFGGHPLYKPRLRYGTTGKDGDRTVKDFYYWKK